MTTEYRVRLDRNACDGIFACLVRDDRFLEASDGLATMNEAADGVEGTTTERSERFVATFDDDRVADARQAARACPVGAIAVDEIETSDEASGERLTATEENALAGTEASDE